MHTHTQDTSYTGRDAVDALQITLVIVLLLEKRPLKDFTTGRYFCFHVDDYTSYFSAPFISH
jgi:hypothetical protein